MVPIQIGSATNWKEVVCGDYHTIGIKQDGTLWAWGYNGYGNLGDGSTENRNVPTQIGTGTNWKQVECGSYHSQAIKSDGTLWVWGYNGYGQLGDGTTDDKHTPVQIGSATNWRQVAGGYYHSLAIKENGTLWAWGYNGYGQLGDGEFSSQLSPVQIGNGTNWKQIMPSGYHTLAIQNNGTLWAWGGNWAGQFGNGTISNYNPNPSQIGNSNNWHQIASGYEHSIGLKSLPSPNYDFVLNSGWNMISINIEPDNSALEDMFSDIVASTVLVKNNLGQIYFPEFEINDIGNWNVKQGYQVYMSKAETLTVPGNMIVPENTPITLSSGWNMIAYLRNNPLDIEIALAPLVVDDKLVIAKDNLGNVYFPAFEINMIGDMIPGQGYQIYLLSGSTLIYPEN